MWARPPAPPAAALRLFVLGAWAAIAGGLATALLLAVSRLVSRALLRPGAGEPPRTSSAT